MDYPQVCWLNPKILQDAPSEMFSSGVYKFSSCMPLKYLTYNLAAAPWLHKLEDLEGRSRQDWPSGFGSSHWKIPCDEGVWEAFRQQRLWQRGRRYEWRSSSRFLPAKINEIDHKSTGQAPPMGLVHHGALRGVSSLLSSLFDPRQQPHTALWMSK